MSNAGRVLILVTLLSPLNTSMIYRDNVSFVNTSLKLWRGDKIVHTSFEGKTILKMQVDGNLLLKHENASGSLTILWHTWTNPYGEYAELHSNGNLQVINATNVAILWESGITGHDNGSPHTIVIAEKCAYIMDRDKNIFWTTSMNSNCSKYSLDLEIQNATQTRPSKSTFLTSLYGNDYYTYIEELSAHLDQGRINAINDWGIVTPSTSYNNTLYIRDWDSDEQYLMDVEAMGNPDADVHHLIPCEPFQLNDNDYIIGYNIYESSDFIHGITFYTSLRCKYECVGASGSGEISGIISYYYSVNEFWYLSGFNGKYGIIIDSLQLQFTELPSGTNLSTSDELLCHATSAPTLNPTVDPTNDPSNAPTVNATNDPTNAPSTHTSLPTIVPTNIPTPSPIHESKIDDYISTTESVIVETQLALSDSTISSHKTIYIVVWVVISLVICCILCITFLKLFHKKGRKKIEKQEAVQLSFAERVNDTNIISLEESSDDGNKDKSDIMQWLTDTVKLPHYYDQFVQNGYDHMDFIRDIVDKSDLVEIGIHKLGHQTRIWAQIKQLKPVEVEGSHSGNVSDESVTRTIEGPWDWSVDAMKQLQTDNGKETDRSGDWIHP